MSLIESSGSVPLGKRHLPKHEQQQQSKQLLRRLPRENRRRALLLQKLGVLENRNAETRKLLCELSDSVLKRAQDLVGERGGKNLSRQLAHKPRHLHTAGAVIRSSANLRCICSTMLQRKTVSTNTNHYYCSRLSNTRREALV